MPTIINCPSCGAPLEVQPGERMIRCKFCNNDVAVPEAAVPAPVIGNLPMGLDLQKLMRLKEVKELARQGRIDESARLYREITGCSEEDARRAAEAIGASQPVVLTGTNLAQVFTGNSSALVEDIENLFIQHGDPRLKAVGELMRAATHETASAGAAVPPSAWDVPAPAMAPSTPSPAATPAEPVIVNPMDAPGSRSGGRGVVIGCAVGAVLALIALAGALAFLFLRRGF
jgi:LSD1 subclass zinc finger protein